MEYVDQEIMNAVQSSFSMRETLQKLGRGYSGGNYSHLKKKIQNIGCSTEHFTGQGWSKGTTRPLRRHIEDYLENKYFINTHALKLRLIREGLKTGICERCGIVEWMGDPMPIELHHIDGNKKDNSFKNLKILCLPCHSQTDNWRGKNTLKCKENKLKQTSKIKKERIINPKYKIDWPIDKELKALLWKSPTVAIAEELGVSDTAINHRCKKRNIPKPPRGYWAKQRTKN